MRFKFSLLVLTLSFVFPLTALAGNIDSPGTSPSAGSGMYTLQGLYDYLLNGVTPAISGIFQGPAAGPAGTGKTTKEIYDGVKALFDAANATAGQVLAGATFFSTDPANWGPRSGTIPTQTPSGATAIQPEGYYTEFNLSAVDTDLTAGNIRSGAEIFGVSGSPTVVDTATGTGAAAGDILSGKTAFVNGSAVTGSVPAGSSVAGTDGSLTVTIPDGLYTGSKTATANDANLVTGNIKSGISIFGVSGDPNVVDTSSGDATGVDIASGKIAWVDGTQINGFGVTLSYPAPVEKTGQTSCWDEPGNSIPCTGTGQDGEYQKGVTPPTPRFTDNGDGTVTDNLTGLIWLKNANCFGSFAPRTWTEALSDCNNLASGSCGLTDGSVAGDWRLPNLKELHSLVDLENVGPSLPAGHPFQNVQSYYWSGSTHAEGPSHAWIVNMYNGYVGVSGKTSTYYVWPVRGGQ